MLENALFRLITAMKNLENYMTEFHQTFSIDAFWDKDLSLNVWTQKVPSQGRSMTKGLAGGGIIQSLTLCGEF